MAARQSIKNKHPVNEQKESFQETTKQVTKDRTITSQPSCFKTKKDYNICKRIFFPNTFLSPFFGTTIFWKNAAVYCVQGVALYCDMTRKEKDVERHAQDKRVMVMMMTVNIIASGALEHNHVSSFGFYVYLCQSTNQDLSS